MRVGLNLFSIAERAGGVGRYARQLTAELLRQPDPPQLTLFVSSSAPSDLHREPWADDVEWVTLPASAAGGRGHVLAELAAQCTTLPWQAARRRLDVVHGIAGVTPPVSPRVATVTTVLDLVWLRHPEVMDRPSRAATLLKIRVGTARADRVIAISHHVADDVTERLGVRRDRVDVVPLGVSTDAPGAATPEAELRAHVGAGDRRIVLCVAQQRPHKNLTGLVRALPLLPDDVVVAICGEPTAHSDALRAEARRLGAESRLLLLGYVDEPDLEGLYAAADVVVLPSFEEGFGLPVLEAMRRGVPVVCSTGGALREAAGDAALMFDPHEERDLAAAVNRVLADDALRARLVAAGRARAADATWARTAHETYAVYEHALERRRI
jgi:glycosyltransferase involved in cell wall biosynthesis